MATFRRQVVAIVSASILAISLAAFLLSAGLQRVISVPIEHLTRTARKISEQRDYSVRAPELGRDEIGMLTRAFNEMLVEVEARDADLQQLRNYLNNIIDSMPSVLIGVNRDGKVTQWNSEAERVTGVLRVDAIGQELPQVFPRLAAEEGSIREAMRTRVVHSSPRQEHRAGDGMLYEDVTVYPLIGEDVEGAVVRVDDVTERVRIEEMMVQSEKMLSVGGLAAGMAHEINNPLAGMIQTADLMRSRLTNRDLPANRRAAIEAGTSMAAIGAFMESRGILEMLGRVHQSGDRAATIVSNMLSFARKSQAGSTSQDLAGLFDRCLDLAGSEYDLKKHYDFRQIEIVREYASDVPPVPCEATKIQQVLLNLLRNGAQAMREAREEGSTRKPRFILRLVHEKAAGMVRIEVEDNGPGMEESVRKRVFEPFFSTKGPQSGTGLGLSVSYFIVTENHHGEMSVESTPGRRTTFIVRLPTAKE